MTAKTMTLACCLILTGVLHLGCATRPGPLSDSVASWPGDLARDDPEQREVTVIIALSSVVPGGIVGHTGIAVDQQYWDFGPQRVEMLQRLKAFDSTAGPWWDDPDQQWETDRTLAEVLEAMPEKIHPPGSIIAVFRVAVTDEQAEAITAFWEETYQRMRKRDDRYQIAGRQCANMVGWSLVEAMDGTDPSGTQLPKEMRLVSPTRLYELLQVSLHHTAGPNEGQPADLTLWQLGSDRLEPWQRPAVWSALGVPELPRTRLAIERMKHLPVALLH